MALLRRPGAAVPLAVSAGFLAFFGIAWAHGALVRRPDEGTAAHLFQILMPAQLLVMGAFAAKWLPRRPRQAVAILALQAAAALAVAAVVYLRHL